MNMNPPLCLHDYKQDVSQHRFMGIGVVRVPRMWSYYCEFVTDFPGPGFLVVMSDVSYYHLNVV